jgi:hypothetical protein
MKGFVDKLLTRTKKSGDLRASNRLWVSRPEMILICTLECKQVISLLNYHETASLKPWKMEVQVEGIQRLSMLRLLHTKQSAHSTARICLGGKQGKTWHVRSGPKYCSTFASQITCASLTQNVLKRLLRQGSFRSGQIRRKSSRNGDASISCSISESLPL